MIDFIPLINYFDIYIHFCFFLVVANLIHAYVLDINDSQNIVFLRASGVFLMLLIIFYLGLRPISSRYFGDMASYSVYFTKYSFGEPVAVTRDYTFHYFMKFISYFTNVHTFFLLTSIIYIYPMYLVSKKYFGDYSFYAFLMLIVSFSCYTYGTNGIRNGLATSIFLLGICYPNKKVLMGVFFLISVLFHKSLLLPVVAFVLTFFYNDPKTYLKVWLGSIPFSVVLGSVFILIFTSLGFGDDRLAGYLSGQADGGAAAKSGFRWDFLFYSSFPVIAGYYFIVKKEFKDYLYNQIFNTYLICNTFWILIIRANFSNRFAYLSWFLMAIIIIYPLLKQRFFENQILVIAKVVTAYFMFTYLMYFIYYG